MSCNCKNTVTSFLGGDVANPTTFLNCGEADGTYNNPLETGKTQCIAENNVLRILDDYKISGTVKNSGQIVFERTVTGSTSSSAGVWETSADGNYLIPIVSINGAGQVSGTSIYTPTLSSTSLTSITVSSTTLIAPSISVGKEAGVISASTIVGKYSGVTEVAAGQEVLMTTALYRPNMVIDARMSAAATLTYTLPEATNWIFGKYTFVFKETAHGSSDFVLNCNGNDTMQGLIVGTNNGTKAITDATVNTFGTGLSEKGTRIDCMGLDGGVVIVTIWATTEITGITPS